MFESRLSICFAVLWAVFAFPGVGRAQSQPSQPVVGIDVGRISGVIEDSVRAFKGIPYAAPPIGPLRWKPPHPVEPWGFVLPADSYGPECIQPRFPGSRGQSEDCLYLNVWTGADEADERRMDVVGDAQQVRDRRHAPARTHRERVRRRRRRRRRRAGRAPSLRSP